MERTDSGILTVTMHTNGGSHIHTGKAHREFPEAFGEIARDRQNEVVIFTGAGDQWISHIDFSTDMGLEGLSIVSSVKSA
jgi:enoyl-CoA hydratase/carnithine racemase